MALVKKKSNSNRIIVIAIGIILLAGVGYFLFTELYLKSQDTNGATGAAGGRRVITNFGQSILNDGRYSELRSYGVNISADANTNPGQPNPFQ